MKLENKTIFVSGANRGIGKAIVEALLKHNVKKIYAGARKIEALPKFGDARVVPVKLDITSREQIKKAAELASDVDILINNAGVATFAGVVTSEQEKLMFDMQVNYFGTLNMVNSFAPGLEKKGGGGYRQRDFRCGPRRHGWHWRLFGLEGRFIFCDTGDARRA